jgi:diguanylate cyclase (GGDEF)-like protein
MLGVSALIYFARTSTTAHPLVLFLHNLVVLVGLGGIRTGTLVRSGLPIPYGWLAVLAVAWIGGIAPFILVYEMPEVRYAMVAVCMAAGSIVSAWSILARKPERNLADRLLAIWFLIAFGFELIKLTGFALGRLDADMAVMLYAVMSPVLFVGYGIFVYQSYALDSIAELNRRSETDALTLVLNRRGFDDRLERALAAANRYRRPLSLVLCDLDRFKRVNDSHGHHAGDLVLQALAKALRRGSRTEDLVARIGGEEFAIIMPDIDAEGAVLCAERLRSEIAQSIEVAGGTLTANFGVADVAESGQEAKALSVAADAALYQAKLGGRNRVERHRAAGQGVDRPSSGVACSRAPAARAEAPGAAPSAVRPRSGPAAALHRLRRFPRRAARSW